MTHVAAIHHYKDNECLSAPNMLYDAFVWWLNKTWSFSSSCRVFAYCGGRKCRNVF